jgi:hypothetical protein
VALRVRKGVVALSGVIRYLVFVAVLPGERFASLSVFNGLFGLFPASPRTF